MEITRETILWCIMICVYAAAFIIVFVFMFHNATAKDFVVARGDAFTYNNSDTPNDNPVTAQYWLFGTTDYIYGKQFKTTGSTYTITIPEPDISSLEPGTYDFYIQFPGDNNVMDIEYNNKNELGNIYKGIANVSIAGLSPKIAMTKFDQIAANPLIDDVIIKNRIIVEEPDIKVKNMYTTDSGALHIDATTNLADGDPIFAMIDEERYQTPEYIAMMSSNATVTGDDDRSFSLNFDKSIAPQLPVGANFISVHFLGDKVTSIPFKRYADYVQPTPAPEINYYYSVNGEMLGYKINTTRPVSNVTVEPTATITYQTVLAQVRMNYSNRSIEQGGDIYIGERNLDIFRTLGWMDASGYYKVQYCEYSDNSTILTVTTPYHFYVDPAIFNNQAGAWCQYQSGLNEPKAVTAFIVKYLPPAKLTSQMVYDNNGARVVTTVPTPTPTPVPVNTTIPTTVPTPTPLPTTESIVVPLPWWLAVVAVAGVMVWKR